MKNSYDIILAQINLTKYYGDILGVKDVSFSLNKGEIFGFIGPNGSGKSTTIKCIMNLINKNEGTIQIDGKTFDKKDYTLKELIGYLPSEIHLYDDLTVEKMLDFHETFYKKNIHDIEIRSIKKNRRIIIRKFKETRNCISIYASTKVNNFR